MSSECLWKETSKPDTCMKLAPHIFKGKCTCTRLELRTYIVYMCTITSISPSFDEGRKQYKQSPYQQHTYPKTHAKGPFNKGVHFFLGQKTEGGLMRLVCSLCNQCIHVHFLLQRVSYLQEMNNSLEEKTRLREMRDKLLKTLTTHEPLCKFKTPTAVIKTSWQQTGNQNFNCSSSQRWSHGWSLVIRWLCCLYRWTDCTYTYMQTDVQVLCCLFFQYYCQS